MIVQFPLALPLLVTILAKDGSNGGACQPLHSFCCSLFFESLRIAITLGERDLSFHVSTLVGIEPIFVRSRIHHDWTKMNEGTLQSVKVASATALS